jgi:hypothetical protein
VTVAEVIKLLWDIAPWLVPPFVLALGLHYGYWVSGREHNELREDRDYERSKRQEAETALQVLYQRRTGQRERA